MVHKGGDKISNHQSAARQEFLRLTSEASNRLDDERFDDEFEEDPGLALFALFTNREERENIEMARGDHILARWQLATA